MRKILLVSLGILMATAISCSSDEKKTAAGDVENAPGIESKDINFDATGSDSGKIAGLSTVHFEYDKSRLTASARKQLAENAEWMRENSNSTVQIEGHCDSRGSVEYNLALGERRAKSVKNYLVSLGVPSKSLTIISYGKEKPLSQGDSDDDFNINRRANFVPLPN